MPAILSQTGVFMTLNTYTVIMLGPSGFGKTVYLASLFKKLSTPGNLNFYLVVNEAQNQKALNRIYTQVATDETWPQGTKLSEISEWHFTCRVQTEDRRIYSACQFTYYDYAGGRITEKNIPDDPDFNHAIKNADALLGLLDGQKLLAFMRNENLGREWIHKDLANMLNAIINNPNPVHFVISKWDIVESHYSLKEIRDRLLTIDAIDNIVKTRNSQGIPVRLIPVSSVGNGFAILQPDGTMQKTGTQPSPFQVEAPLACILRDKVEQYLSEKVRELEELEANLNPEVEVKLEWWEKIGLWAGEKLRGGLSIVRQVLPDEYKLAEPILRTILEQIEGSALQKQENAQKRTEELQRIQREKFTKVQSEESALDLVVSSFSSVIYRLESSFPETNLR